ncbi:MAG: zinc ribbon domain-containing protein [Acidiferrobacterales bacterium]|nr:zinc ribbon domain-containing protein [Acidiferrobacterales bacterium]
MPVYDYKCQEHGVFNDLAPMADHDKPGTCPTCGAMSARIIVISPEFLNMNQQERHAEEVNEKAQHEPVVSSKERRADDQQHAQGCGCQDKKPSKLMYTAQGDKMFPSMRPWMISH